ncbi:MAG TPA: tetratricopeptide repeat protein [Candidatus Angelobacter sp.]|nr:tetratricopeptide repeat protein [Candidatus Angelobacter sp.]
MKFLRKPLLLACCFVVVAFSPLLAQKGGSGGGGAPKGGPAPSPAPVSGPSGNVYSGNPYPGNIYSPSPWPYGLCEGNSSCPTSTPRPMPAQPTQDDATCFLPPAAGIYSATVSLTRLEVPEKARNEYEKACSALHHKNFAKAQEHLEKAIQNYSAYAAAWVLLGQVQERQKKEGEATESCTRGLRIDSSYLPSYLCLAHIAASEKKWDRVAELTNHVLEFHPIQGANAYYYNALAYLHLNQLSSAETSARRGVEDTRKHEQPLLHLLLAQIYEKKGDRSSEVVELRAYLKLAPHGDDAAEVNDVLKAIKEEPAGQP